ncbi:MAG: hypothetical protein IJ363_03575 [Clostridia bacterium]|nr:hypothetical protein [Clostridia bacterium]
MKTTRIGLLILSVLLCIALGVAFTACTGGDTPTDTTVADTPAPTEPDTEAPTDTPTEPDTTEAPTEAPTEPEETEPPIVDVMVGETLDAPHATQFTVSNVFANDMVVQRNEHIRVWGWADASQNGKKVTGEFKGMFAEAIIEDGAWEITFGARMEASAEPGHTMKIYADGVSYEFTDVLVGDVYMVMGQSNCAYSVSNHHAYVNTPDKGGKDVLDYDAPIRIHYNSQTQTAGYPKWGTEEVCLEVKSGSTWQRADSYADIQNFTAIGYLFAHNYVKLTDSKVPIGLIEIDGNGRPLGAFMCNEVATEKGTDRYDSGKGYFVTTGVNGDAGRFLYNCYMYPFERYAIAGLIWYQGESDLLQANARVYTENFSALMTYMRGTHNLVNKDFPVYYVEFPTIYQQPAGFTGQWHYMDVGLIRAVMGEIQRVLPNSYQIVSTDLWSDDTFFNNLHPNCKFEQSERIATLAAAVNGEAGKTVEQGNGPVLVSMEVLEGGKKAILTYENVGEGLKTTDGGTEVKGFCIYRKNCSVNSRSEVTATITAPNQITIESNASISGLAYNAVTYNVYGVDVNLCNSEGVPAGATIILKED